MASSTALLSQLLETDSGIDAGYVHKNKKVTPNAPLEREGLLLKWYDLAPEDRPVPEEIGRMARQYLLESDVAAKGIGFVILHRCGNDFYFLLVQTWRNSNEMWESVYYKDGEAMSGFAPFPQPPLHKGTFCVWELVAVWHEQQAWKRFLHSSRDEAAGEAWLRDQASGPA